MNKNNNNGVGKNNSKPSSTSKETEIFKKVVAQGGTVLFVFDTDDRKRPISSQKINISRESLKTMNPKTKQEKYKTPHEFFKMWNDLKIDLGAKYFLVQV